MNYNDLLEVTIALGLTLLFVTGLCVAGWNKVNRLMADIEAIRRKVRS